MYTVFVTEIQFYTEQNTRPLLEIIERSSIKSPPKPMTIIYPPAGRRTEIIIW